MNPKGVVEESYSITYDRKIKQKNYNYFDTCTFNSHYRKPSTTMGGKGIFELKPEFYKEYDRFFLHYSRTEQSKV